MSQTRVCSDEELVKAGKSVGDLIAAAELRGEGVPESTVEGELHRILGSKLPVPPQMGYMMMHYAQGRHDKDNHMWYKRFGKAGRDEKKVNQPVPDQKKDGQSITLEGDLFVTAVGSGNNLKTKAVKVIIFLSILAGLFLVVKPF